MRSPSLLFALVASIGFVGGISLLRNRDDLSYTHSVDSSQEEVARVIDDWLSAMSKGQDCGQYWLNESWVEPAKFFAVRDWQIMDNQGTSVVVRVASSNRAGQPIVALWRVSISYKERKIYSVKNVDEEKQSP